MTSKSFSSVYDALPGAADDAAENALVRLRIKHPARHCAKFLRDSAVLPIRSCP